MSKSTSRVTYILRLICFSLVTTAVDSLKPMPDEKQQPISQPQSWSIHLSNEWDVLGPFPIHAREQYFFSPAFPLEVYPQYMHESEKTWPSAYSSSGSVGWSKSSADDDGNLAVSFPEVDWDGLRSTEGWAALQYHAVLHAKLTLYPPGWDASDYGYEHHNECSPSKSEASDALEEVPFRVLASLVHGSQFTLMPSQENPGPKSQKLHVPIWHTGNIYGINRSPLNAVELPSVPSKCHPTTYDVFVSGDYEIRLFGDPKDSNDSSPTLRLSFNVSLEMKDNKVIREISHDIVPDFVDGYAFGDAISVGLRSVDGWWIVRNVSPGKDFPPELNLSLRHDTVGNHVRRHRLAPTQTRMLPLLLEQRAPCLASSINFLVVLVESKPSEGTQENARQINLEITLTIRHVEQWSVDGEDVIRASFIFREMNPTLFLVKPPFQTDEHVGTNAPLLALHGAGVDIFASTFWADVIPRQNHSWIVIPPGRTEWGLDWHGPSAAEAWACVSALQNILTNHKVFRAWRIAEDAKVVLIGHSNGGQGVWYMASRFPDRVLAAIPAAGYIKSQAYVPLTQSRSAHYMDPSLRAILESSLTPDDNDLFLSNLVDIPVFAIHGGKDTNVPTWHSRQYIASLKEWGARNAILHIDEGKPHFYPEIFRGFEVLEFLQNVTSRNLERTLSSAFTLTVINPAHSGSMRGWTIDSIKIPGRLARLSILLQDRAAFVRTENVEKFTIGCGDLGSAMNIEIDTSYGPYLVEHCSGGKGVTFVYNKVIREWQIAVPSTTNDEEELEMHIDQFGYRRRSLGSLHGRAQDILGSPDIHMIVIPDHSRALSAAQRVAHILNVYHKLGAEIYTSDEAMALWKSDPIGLRLGNLVALGQSRFTDKLISQKYTPFSLHKQGMKYTHSYQHTYDDPGTGFILLHPHPTNAGAKTIIVSGTNWEGFERATRAFPYRTGVPIPDFLIIGPAADKRGAAGILGAGVFSDLWQHNDPMTWQT